MLKFITLGFPTEWRQLSSYITVKIVNPSLLFLLLNLYSNINKKKNNFLLRHFSQMSNLYLVCLNILSQGQLLFILTTFNNNFPLIRILIKGCSIKRKTSKNFHLLLNNHWLFKSHVLQKGQAIIHKVELVEIRVDLLQIPKLMLLVWNKPLKIKAFTSLIREEHSGEVHSFRPSHYITRDIKTFWDIPKISNKTILNTISRL